MDERLMQVVRLSDSLMRSNRRAAGSSLHTRPFGLTPLGPRLGLVQWVDHTIPIFQVCLISLFPLGGLVSVLKSAMFDISKRGGKEVFRLDPAHLCEHL